MRQNRVCTKRHVHFFGDQKARARYLRIFQWTLVAVIFVFLGKMVWDNWSEVKDTPFTLKMFPFALATLIFAFSYFIQVWAWYLITLKLGIAIPLSETLESWFYSQLGKYLPGKVWILLGRFYFYESKGKSKKEISIALYLEIITMIMAAGLLFLAALLFFKEEKLFYSGRQFWWLIPPFVLAFILLHPRVLQRILNWTLIQFRREPISLSISYPDVLWVLLICILSWIVGGMGFYLFVQSTFPVSTSYVLFLAGALAFSSTLGLVAVFAPSGLGVREGTLVYMLSFIMPGSVAVIISILTRIWMTLIEIGLIGVIYLNDKFEKRLTQKG